MGQERERGRESRSEVARSPSTGSSLFAGHQTFRARFSAGPKTFWGGAAHAANMPRTERFPHLAGMVLINRAKLWITANAYFCKGIGARCRRPAGVFPHFPGTGPAYRQDVQEVIWIALNTGIRRLENFLKTNKMEQHANRKNTWNAIEEEAPHPAENYTPHVPPKPIVTFSPSTITGTSLCPFENLNISFIASAFFKTFSYTKGILRLAKSSRAAIVCGHVSLPKMMIFSLMTGLLAEVVFPSRGSQMPPGR
jgi:hypothetical protein